MPAQTAATTLPGTASTIPAYPAEPPVFPQGLSGRHVLLTAANTNFATPVGDTKLISATDNPTGCLVKRVFCFPLATNTATVVQLFRNLAAPAAGSFQSTPAASSKLMADSLTVAAQTISSTAGPTTTDFPRFTLDNPLRLGPGEELTAAISVALSTGWVVGCEVEFFALKP